VPNSISELSNLLCLMTWPIGREIMEESIFSTLFWTFEVFFEEKKFLMFLVEKVIFLIITKFDRRLYGMHTITWSQVGAISAKVGLDWQFFFAAGDLRSLLSCFVSDIRIEPVGNNSLFFVYSKKICKQNDSKTELEEIIERFGSSRGEMRLNLD
jgi:hypothetical protein